MTTISNQKAKQLTVEAEQLEELAASMRRRAARASSDGNDDDAASFTALAEDDEQRAASLRAQAGGAQQPATETKSTAPSNGDRGDAIVALMDAKRSGGSSSPQRQGAQRSSAASASAPVLDLQDQIAKQIYGGLRADAPTWPPTNPDLQDQIAEHMLAEREKRAPGAWALVPVTPVINLPGQRQAIAAPARASAIDVPSPRAAGEDDPDGQAADRLIARMNRRFAPARAHR